MKRTILLFMFMLTIISMVSVMVCAENSPAQIIDQTQINLSEQLSPALEPIVNTIQPLLEKISVIIGGLFGLYIILVLLRVYYERKTLRLLNDIRYDLDHLNMHYELPHSRESNGIFRRLWHSLRNGKKLEDKSKKKKKTKR